MPNLLFIDTEFGGLPDAEFQERDFGLTQISAVDFSGYQKWSKVRINAFFDTYIRPVDGLIYEDEALVIQAEWLREDLSYLYQEHFVVEVGNDGDEGSHYEELPDCPSLADAFYFWLELNGRDEKTALEGFLRWVNHHYPREGEQFRVSPWGFNVTIDLKMIESAVFRHWPETNQWGSNDHMPCNRSGRDGCMLFRIMRDLELHGVKIAKLDAIAEYYGIELPPGERHTSKGDVTLSIFCIRAMMEHMLSRTYRPRPKKADVQKQSA